MIVLVNFSALFELISDRISFYLTMMAMNMIILTLINCLVVMLIYKRSDGHVSKLLSLPTKPPTNSCEMQNQQDLIWYG